MRFACLFVSLLCVNLAIADQPKQLGTLALQVNEPLNEPQKKWLSPPDRNNRVIDPCIFKSDLPGCAGKEKARNPLVPKL